MDRAGTDPIEGSDHDPDVRITVGPMRAAGIRPREGAPLGTVEAVEDAMRAEGLRVQLVRPEEETRGAQEVLDFVMPAVMVLKEIGFDLATNALWAALERMRQTPGGEGRGARMDVTFRRNGNLRRFRAPCNPDSVEALRVLIERDAVNEEEPPEPEPRRTP